MIATTCFKIQITRDDSYANSAFVEWPQFSLAFHINYYINQSCQVIQRRFKFRIPCLLFLGYFMGSRNIKRIEIEMTHSK